MGSARSVLNDWNTGRIPFFTVPPPAPDPTLSSASAGPATKDASSAAGLVAGDAIVNEFAPEFDLDKLFGEADGAALDGLKSAKEMTGVVKATNGAATSGTAGEEGNVKLFGEKDVSSDRCARSFLQRPSLFCGADPSH
jgi:nuclear GTP-binding protein